MAKEKVKKGRQQGESFFAEEPELAERVISVNRVSKVVKGGKRFSFNALVVVGDGKSKIGCGFGKANGVPEAINKATQQAKKHIFTVSLDGTTIPHEIIGCFGASRIILRPASPGTGVIAGGSARPVLDLGGVKDVLTKSMGSNNPINLVRATLQGLQSLKTKEDVEKRRRTGEMIDVLEEE